ncbi:MAG: hypothetical protein QNJ98_02715 [Planctomycetota bacterium]|nr:hypothetical protein [Planctomycetota bacterium]
MIAPIRAVDDRGGMDYLGPEFLTWLWWRAEADPCFRHEDGTEVFVHFDEHLEFRGERSAARRVILRTGMPGASMEARAALRSGKTLVSARILMARGEDEVRFTLRAEDLDISGLRLPAPEGDTPYDRLVACLDAQDQFVDDLELCLKTFLATRLEPRWEEEVETIRRWSRQPSQDEIALPA